MTSDGIPSLAHSSANRARHHAYACLYAIESSPVRSDLTVLYLLRSRHQYRQRHRRQINVVTAYPESLAGDELQRLALQQSEGVRRFSEVDQDASFVALHDERPPFVIRGYPQVAHVTVVQAHVAA